MKSAFKPPKLINEETLRRFLIDVCNQLNMRFNNLPVLIDNIHSGLKYPKTHSNAGDAIASGTVSFYEVNEDTPETTAKTVWEDVARQSAVSGKVLDSSGSADIYALGKYYITVDDSAGNRIYTWPNQEF